MPSLWPEQCHQSHLTAQGNVLQSTESQKSFTLTMVIKKLVPSLLISAPLGVSPMIPQALTIHNQIEFAEACVKSVKHALQYAQYSGADLQLTLLVL